MKNVKSKSRFILLEEIGEKLRYGLLSKYADLEITKVPIKGLEYPDKLEYNVYENSPPYDFIPESNNVPEYFGVKKLV